MRLHEIDFESGREFKRRSWKQPLKMDDTFFYWVNTNTSFNVESLDILADDWEYCDEVKKQQWYKHEVYLSYRSSGDQAYYYEPKIIYSDKTFGELELGSRSVLLKTITIEKPSWIKND